MKFSFLITAALSCLISTQAFSQRIFTDVPPSSLEGPFLTFDWRLQDLGVPRPTLTLDVVDQFDPGSGRKGFVAESSDLPFCITNPFQLGIGGSPARTCFTKLTQKIRFDGLLTAEEVESFKAAGVAVEIRISTFVNVALTQPSIKNPTYTEEVSLFCGGNLLAKAARKSIPLSSTAWVPMHLETKFDRVNLAQCTGSLSAVATVAGQKIQFLEAQTSYSEAP